MAEQPAIPPSASTASTISSLVAVAVLTATHIALDPRTRRALDVTLWLRVAVSSSTARISMWRRSGARRRHHLHAEARSLPSHRGLRCFQEHVEDLAQVVVVDAH